VGGGAGGAYSTASTVGIATGGTALMFGGGGASYTQASSLGLSYAGAGGAFGGGSGGAVSNVGANATGAAGGVGLVVLVWTEGY